MLQKEEKSAREVKFEKKAKRTHYSGMLNPSPNPTRKPCVMNSCQTFVQNDESRKDANEMQLAMMSIFLYPLRKTRARRSAQPWSGAKRVGGGTNYRSPRRPATKEVPVIVWHEGRSSSVSSWVKAGSLKALTNAESPPISVRIDSLVLGKTFAL